MRQFLEDESAVKYIRKDTNKIEISNILGTIKPIEYKNEQKDLKRIINQLTEEKVKEIEISRREYFYLKKKLQDSKLINIKNKTLEKFLQLQLEK